MTHNQYSLKYEQYDMIINYGFVINGEWEMVIGFMVLNIVFVNYSVDLIW